MKSKLYIPGYIAWSTLTALPLPGPGRFEASDQLYGFAARLFPLVGALLGLLLWFTAWLFNTFNIPLGISAPLLLGIYYLATGFIHFDGLCDVCDAFLAQRDKATRLAILKDSRIGAYALGCGTIYLIFKTALIYQTLKRPEALVLLFTMVILSRLAMVILAFYSHYPRSEGTGRPYIGQLTQTDLTWALGLGGALLVITLVNGVAPLVCVTQIGTLAVVCAAVRVWSRRKIGGVTGDVLGAAGEINDVAVLGISLALLSFLD